MMRNSLLRCCRRIILISWYPVQVAISYPTAQRSLASPGSVGSDGDLPAVVSLSVVDIKLERPALVSLYETEEILTLV